MDGTDRSTRVIVNQQFLGDGGSANVPNMRLLLFAHSKQIARIRVVDGRWLMFRRQTPELIQHVHLSK